MKILDKKLFAFFMVLCMIAPMLMIPAFAADTSPHGSISEERIDISENEVMSFLNPLDSFETSESVQMVNDGISPLVSSTDRDMGVGLRSITVYPLAYDLETETLFSYTNVYKRVLYTNWSKFEGINLSKSDTLSLMQKFINEADSNGENYILVGWRLVGTIECQYRNPQYLLYHRRATGLELSQPDTKREITPYSKQTITTYYLYPDNVDVLEDYYFVGVTGACYYKMTSGQESGTMFNYSAAFNN